MTSDEERIETAALWTRAKSGDARAVSELVERYHWLPVKIARSKRVPPHFDREDVGSWANAGLFDAVRKFKPDSGNGQLHEHFIGYATLRINGSILDGMKAPGQSWATRDVWRKVKEMHLAEEIVGQHLGRPPTRTEVADYLGVDPANLPLLQQQVHLDARYADDEAASFDILPSNETTDGIAEISEVAERLAAKLVDLPAGAQALAAELFFHGREVRHVVEQNGTTLPRVRRERARMLLQLRDLLQRS